VIAIRETRCSVCGDQIMPGDSVELDEDDYWIHEECAIGLLEDPGVERDDGSC
jgi:hypothetical protein